MDIFSERIKTLRKNIPNLTQGDVADAIHISRSAYCNYENGIAAPVNVVISLAQYYDVSTDYLLGLSNDTSVAQDEIATAMKKMNNLTVGKTSEAITTRQLTVLIDALAEYYNNGAPAGDSPLLAVSDYLNHMTAFIRALTGASTAEMLSAANATAEDILAVNKIFHKAMTKEE